MISFNLSKIEYFIAKEAFACFWIASYKNKGDLFSWMVVQELTALLGQKRILRFRINWDQSHHFTYFII